MPKMEYSVPHCSAVVADSRWTINKDATRRTILRPIRQIISLQITFDQKYSPFEWLIFYRIMLRDGGFLKQHSKSCCFLCWFFTASDVIVTDRCALQFARLVILLLKSDSRFAVVRFCKSLV